MAQMEVVPTAPPGPRPETMHRPISRRTGQPRAMDMDETLAMTKSLRSAVENLSEKQQEAVHKIKGEKGMMKQVQAKIQEYEEKVEKMRLQHQAAKEAAATAQAELRKQREQHEVLNASNSWTKSALDAALAAQEEYKKGYHSLKVTLQKTKDDLDGQRKELEVVRGATSDLQTMQSFYQTFLEKRKRVSSQVLERMIADQAEILLRTCVQAWWQGAATSRHARRKEEEMKKAEDHLQAVMERQAAQAKMVLDRIGKANDDMLLSGIMAAWLTDAQEERAKRALEQRLQASEASMSEFQQKTRAEAYTVLVQMAGGKAVAQLEAAWTGWRSCIEDVRWEREVEKKMKETSARLEDKLRHKNSEAKHVLERIVTATVEGLQLQVLRSWMAFIVEERRERQLVEEQQKKMRSYTDKKKNEAMGIMQRVGATNEANLLASVFLGWQQAQLEEKHHREVESELRAECGEQVDALRGHLLQAEETAKALDEERGRHKVAQDALEAEAAELRKKRDTKKKELDDLERDLRSKVAQAEGIAAELADSKDKTRILRQHLQKLQDMHEQLSANYEEMLAE